MKDLENMSLEELEAKIIKDWDKRIAEVKGKGMYSKEVCERIRDYITGWEKGEATSKECVEAVEDIIYLYNSQFE